MEFDGNLEVLSASLAPPPGYERAATTPSEPAEPLVLTLNARLEGARDTAHATRLAEAAVTSEGIRAREEGVTTPPPLRLVSADDGPVLSDASPVTDQAVHPISAIGRITAVFEGRIRYCTGTVIAERIVLTAAHCAFLRDGPDDTRRNGFADWILFEPQYSAGESLGQWAGASAYVLSGWSDPDPGSSAGPYDFAFITLDAPIAAETGTVGLFTNREPEGPFTSFGYPRQPSAGYLFDGNRLYATTGRLTDQSAPGLIQAENTLTEGSSGGPWIVEHEGTLKVAGLNSAKPLLSDAHTWSPVLGQPFLTLLGKVLADMTGV